MTTAAFDTLKLSRRLEAAGLSQAQATGFAEALSDVMITELATKADLRTLEVATKADFRALEISLRGDMRELRLEINKDMERMRGDLRTEIASSKGDILRWIVPLMLAHMALTVGTLLRVTS
ncbi:MAG: hypothetical protein FJX57_00355 [Alphaproteobacteria bacterium]|nr:hypothetical protein [Alphaproteobacteria bacterium]